MLTVAKTMNEVFKYLQANFQSEIETIRNQYASEPFLFTEEPLVLK
jgi:hypothetical protein